MKLFISMGSGFLQNIQRLHLAIVKSAPKKGFVQKTYFGDFTNFKLSKPFLGLDFLCALFIKIKFTFFDISMKGEFFTLRSPYLKKKRFHLLVGPMNAF
jgi:hypothetical protein